MKKFMDKLICKCLGHLWNYTGDINIQIRKCTRCHKKQEHHGIVPQHWWDIIE